MRVLKLGMLSWFLLLCCIPSFARKKALTVKAITSHSEISEYNIPITTPGTPGSSSTNCSGNGTPDYGGGTRINMDCNTTTTPPTPPTPPKTQETRISQGIVTNIVEGWEAGKLYRYTIQCTANWSGTKCGPLADGATFFAEIDATTMWIPASTGKIKYKILGVRPSDSEPQEKKYNLNSFKWGLDRLVVICGQEEQFNRTIELMRKRYQLSPEDIAPFLAAVTCSKSGSN